MKIMQRLQFFIIIKSPLLLLLMMMMSCGVQLKTQNYFIAVIATSSGQADKSNISQFYDG